MTVAVAGWYPDPAGGPSSRWWDGQQWTEATMPAVPVPAQGYAAVAGGYGQPGGGYPAYDQVLAPNRTFWQANRYTCLAVGFAVVYALLALFAHFVVFGIVPVLFAVRAFRAKERYAVAAAVAAALAVVLSLSQLAQGF
jgi:hypothetical protein